MAERDGAGKKVKKAATAAATWEQEQSVLGFRKVLMRRHLLRWLRHSEGVYYVPFIGDGDIAVECYTGKTILGADLDPERVETARDRLPGQDIRVADCNLWPFPDNTIPVALADFDAYSDPYASFRSFWAHAPKADRLVMCFTDGHRQGLNRTGWWDHPDGRKIRLGSPDGPRMGDRDKKLPIYGAYLSKHIWPWFDQTIVAPDWRILDRWRYQRDMMIYWGMAIERKK